MSDKNKYENTADQLEEQAEIAREASKDAERAVRAAKIIAAENKKQETLLDQVDGYLNASKPKAGNIKRFVGAPFSVISVVDPVYKSAQAQIQGASVAKGMEVFAKSYVKQVRDSIATMATGKDYLSGQKHGQDILVDQLGFQKSWKTTVAGLGLDIGGDAGSFMSVGVKPVLKGMSAIGKFGVEYASKVPKIEKSIEGLKRNFNIFYDLEKTMPKADVDEFKILFREAASTGDLSKLKAFKQQIINTTESVGEDAVIKIAAAKRAVENLTASVSGAKLKYVNALFNQHKVQQESLGGLFKSVNGQGLNEKWLSGSGMAMRDTTAPLLTLPIEVKRQVMASVEQWTHIIAQNTNAQAYRNFANELLPRLKQGLNVKQIDSAVDVAKKQYNSLTGELAAAKNHLDTLINPPQALKIAPRRPPLRVTPNTQPQAYQDVIREAFETEMKSGPIGKTIDATNNMFKRILSWMPNFQFRNAQGTALMGVAEGARLQDFWKGAQTYFTKGKNNPGLYAEFEKNGLTKQTGMYEQGLERLPAKISNAVETIGRTSLVFADLRKQTMSLAEAIAHSDKTFFQYNKAYFTAWEKKYAKRADPFYAWDKGLGSWSTSNLAEKAPFWNKLYKVKEGTLTDTEKEYKNLSPTYRKDQFTVGSWNNFGAPLEDVLRVITLDFKALAGHTQILGKSMVELGLDWKFFQGKALSGDTAAGGYANMPVPFQKIMGYDKDTNTVNPYSKWLLESLIPAANPVRDLFDPNKSLKKSISSLGPQDTSLSNFMAQQEMERRNVSFIDHQKNRLAKMSSLGTGNGLVDGILAQAATTAPQTRTLDAIDRHNANFLNGKIDKINVSPADFGKKYVYGMGAEQNLVQSALQKFGDIIADANQYLESNIGKNWEASSQQKLANLKASAKWAGQLESPEFLAARDALTKKQIQTRPRLMGVEDPLFKPDDFIWRRTLGLNPMDQYYNKSLEERVSFTSKTADIWKASQARSPQMIQRGLEADMAALKIQMEAQGGGISDKMAQSRMAALRQQAEENMGKLETRAKVATGNILKDWADAQINGFNKIELNRQAEIQKYYGSDDYRDAFAAKDFDKINNAINAKNAKFAKERQDLLAKEAKSHLDYLKAVTDGEAANSIAGLKGIYERGGLTIKEFYDKQLKTQVNQQTKIGVGALETLMIIAKDKVRSDADQLSQPKVPRAPLAYHKQKEAPTSIQGVIEDIIDGDTVDIKMKNGDVHRVRLAYIDTPETAKPAMGDEPAKPGQPFGEAAKATLTELVGGIGGVVNVKVVGTDYHDRLLGEVTANGKAVDLEMVKRGLAEIIPHYMPDKATYDKYSANLKPAVDNGVGMYSQSTYQSPGDYRHTGSKQAMIGDMKAVDETLATLRDITDALNNPDMDPRTKIHALNQAIELINTKLPGIEFSKLEETFKVLAKVSSEVAGASQSAASGITTDTATLNRAITDLHANAAKLRSQVYATTGIRTLGLRSTSGASTKFGYNTAPFAPTGYNRDAEALKTELDSVDASASQFFQKNTDTEGELAFKAKTIDQSDSGYLMQIETELQKHENNKANISETGKKKLEALQENYAAFVMTSENKIAISQEQVMQKRLTTAGDMAGMMTKTAEMIYEATGKQSKEAFYAMKAMAIAEATIKGVQSVISAFKAGNDVGGPTVGTAYAAIASAFVGTQVGILTSQMVNGPEAKAEGGPIKGGSGRRDDVPILAMGGEYVIRKSSVSKYGANFLDALNKGVIPVSAFNFSIPSPPIYDTNQVHFADGGLVGVHKPTPVTVELKNESGTPLKQTKSDVNFNGQEYVVTVWLDALERNVGGLRSALGG